MALMLDASAAKSMIPFPESTAHDLWLTLGCSELGKCSFTMTPLVKYRRHGGNETGFLAGVSSKDDWYSTRVKTGLILLGDLPIDSRFTASKGNIGVR